MSRARCLESRGSRGDDVCVCVWRCRAWREAIRGRGDRPDARCRVVASRMCRVSRCCRAIRRDSSIVGVRCGVCVRALQYPVEIQRRARRARCRDRIVTLSAAWRGRVRWGGGSGPHVLSKLSSKPLSSKKNVDAHSCAVPTYLGSIKTWL